MPHGSSKIAVFEIERVQLIRRKCRLHSRICEQCGNAADFITLIEAARLFEINSSRLYRFVESNAVHYADDAKSGVILCINSLIERLFDNNRNSKIKMIS